MAMSCDQRINKKETEAGGQGSLSQCCVYTDNPVHGPQPTVGSFSLKDLGVTYIWVQIPVS